MGRLTISLSEESHRALKEAAARQHRSIRDIIESSLDNYGIKPKKSATHYVATARANSGLGAADAMGSHLKKPGHAGAHEVAAGRH